MADINGHAFANQPAATGNVNALPAPPDATAPIITNFSPATNIQIEVNDPIEFDIIDSFGNLELFVLLCSFADGSVFVIHDGDVFRWPFLGIKNKRVNITNGFRYTVLKDDGWFGGITDAAESPTFEFLARDAVGNAGVIV